MVTSELATPAKSLSSSLHECMKSTDAQAMTARHAIKLILIFFIYLFVVFSFYPLEIVRYDTFFLSRIIKLICVYVPPDAGHRRIVATLAYRI